MDCREGEGSFMGIDFAETIEESDLATRMSEDPHARAPADQGSDKDAQVLLPLVYAELRKLAAQKMAAQPPGQTLQATALVHEAYLRLADNTDRRWNDAHHFYCAAAEAMRRILVDNARRKHRIKRGAGQQPLNLEDVDVATNADPENLLLVHEALETLAATDLVKAELVKLRFFVGLTNQEAAKVLGLSEKTVKRYWIHARAWLYLEVTKLAGAA